jgi:transcriptional regulator with PAS, ATPase and Fis domain
MRVETFKFKGNVIFLGKPFALNNFFNIILAQADRGIIYMASLIRLDNGQIFNITNKIDIIGRGSSASVFLDDDGVSRNHAEVFMMSGCVEVIDLNSRNGILVNGKKIRKSFLNDGDKLSVGSVDLVFSNQNIDSNQTINMKVQTSSTIPTLQTSASGRMELILLRPNDSYLQSGQASLSTPYLELLFKSSLELQNYKGMRRFSEVVFKQIEKIFTPTLIVIKLIDEVAIEKPMGCQKHIASELFDQSLTQGMAYLRRKNTQNEMPSVICSPIMDNKKNFIGAVYLESQERNYEMEDLLFIRAFLAQAAEAKEEENVETVFLPPSNTPSQTNEVKKFSPEELVILGKSEAIKLLKSRIGDLANESRIMISGPLGTNRTLISSNLHCMSNHTDKPYITVDCSLLNHAVLQEELFGRKGGPNIGKFREAEGGTLFLNKISCLPIEMQGTIALYLKNGTITPIGGEAEPISLTLVTGVRGRPEAAVERGTLSKTLLEEFAGKRLHVPLLDKRKDDIPEIANHFFLKFLKIYNKQGMIIPPETEQKMLNYPWPGNDRELELILERAILCCDHKSLTPEYLALPGE